jgi:hypothetical protein
MSIRKRFVILTAMSLVLGTAPICVWGNEWLSRIADEWLIADLLFAFIAVLALPGILATGGIHDGGPLRAIILANSLYYGILVFLLDFLRRKARGSKLFKHTLFPHDSDKN